MIMTMLITTVMVIITVVAITITTTMIKTACRNLGVLPFPASGERCCLLHVPAYRRETPR